MCTSITFKTKAFYFGRTLDLEYSYKEEVVITPRNFSFELSCGQVLTSHFAIIGTAYVPDKLPLYYEGINEKGLCMAGLNFAGNAKYNKPAEGAKNIAQYELILYILCTCARVNEAVLALKAINVTDRPYGKGLPVAELHWLLADKSKCVTVELVSDGLKIYDNPVGVLANNPTFDMHVFNLNNYIGLSAEQPQNSFSDKLNLQLYTKGLGAMGLPGDLSSQSRFVRAAVNKLNSVCGSSEEESVNQFFHILGSVEQPRGANRLENGKYEITVYTCCCNADTGVYYYTTYQNHRITAVDMHKENLNSDKLVRYPHILRESFDNS